MTFALMVLRYWKYAVMGALALYIGYQHLLLAHKDAQIAGLKADVKVMSERVVEAQRAVAVAKNVNDGNLHELDRIRRDGQAAVDAITRDRDRALAAKQQVQVVRKVIRERVEVCPPGGIPPGVDRALDWLRDNPAVGSGSYYNHTRSGAANPGGPPRLPD